MNQVHTRYGILKGVSFMDCYPDGSPRKCVVTEPNALNTPYGILVPLYRDNEIRRKSGKPLTFYPNGCLKNLPLQHQAGIPTPLGVLPAEYLAFYEDGSLSRVFPLDGKLSGYWEEEDERKLSYEMAFELSCGRFISRIMGLHFYPSGSLKSITLWPGEVVTVNSPLGTIDVRTGLSFYPGGQLRSLEPAGPTPVQTPLGTIYAYDNQSIGLNGDVNSLCFSEEGAPVSLLTSTDEIEVRGSGGEKFLFRPDRQPDLADPDVLIPLPLKLEFAGSKILFHLEDGIKEFDIHEHTFAVRHVPGLQAGCSNCHGCAGCAGRQV